MRRVYVEEASEVARELYLGMVVDRKAESGRGDREHRGRHGDRRGRRQDARKDHHRADRSAARAGGVSGAQNRVRAGAARTSRSASSRRCSRALYRAFIETDASLIEINPLVVTKDGTRDLPRRQNVVRRQRPVSPSRHPRTARPQRRRSGRDRGRQVRSQLRASRRQHRMHGQRRGARDGDDGHREVLRRRAGQLPRRRRRRERAEGRGGVSHPARRRARQRRC